MDEIDLRILEILSQNGRESHENISKALNLSRPAVRKRVKKLEDIGLIKRYQAIINWAEMGQNINVLIYIKINNAIYHKIIGEITEISVPNLFLEEYFRLAGEWCIMLKVRSTSPQNITQYLDELFKINGVVGTSTTFILSSSGVL